MERRPPPTELLAGYTSYLDWPYTDPLAPLQTYDVHIPHSTPQSYAIPPARRLWIIYIHGGAWRDPHIDARSLFPALRRLADPNAQHASVAGYASLNYRLSPYPAGKEPPASALEAAHAARRVTHPAHRDDVVAAITQLQDVFGFGARYLLVGHSCGATLALQAVGGFRSGGDSRVEEEVAPWGPERAARLPLGVVGVAGIYALGALVGWGDRAGGTTYHDFVHAAFGPAEGDWDAASPACGRFDPAVWPAGCFVGLLHSRDDELVDGGQVAAMRARLEAQADGQPRARMRVVECAISGSHDDAWETGEGITRAIGLAMELVRELDAAEGQSGSGN